RPTLRGRASGLHPRHWMHADPRIERMFAAGDGETRASGGPQSSSAIARPDRGGAAAPPPRARDSPAPARRHPPRTPAPAADGAAARAPPARRRPRGRLPRRRVTPVPNGQKIRFFSQLRGERRTADPAELLFSRQQNGAGRGRSGLYVPAGWLEGLSRMGLASGGSGRPVLGGAGTGPSKAQSAFVRAVTSR